MKPTNISLQLVERLVKYPISIIEDVPIRIGKLYIPIDFVIMEIEECSHVTSILDRPFLSRTRTIIYVKQVRLAFEAGEENIEFVLAQVMKKPFVSDSCLSINITNQDIKEKISKKEEGENEKVKACEKFAQKSEVLAHGTAPKFKEKPIPSDLNNEPMHKRKIKG